MKMISWVIVLAMLIVSLGGCHGVGHWVGKGHYKHKKYKDKHYKEKHYKHGHYY